MEKMTKENIRVHIEYQGEMTLRSLEDSLRILNEAFRLYHDQSYMKLSESNEESPKVISVSDGSFVVDVVVPITCTLLPILYDIIKNHFLSENGKYKVDVEKYDSRLKWTNADNYQICKAVLTEYVIKQENTSVGKFMNSLTLKKPYSKNSIRAKIQNTKCLMEKDMISNTLRIAGREHYSNGHYIQFMKARENLGI